MNYNVTQFHDATTQTGQVDTVTIVGPSTTSVLDSTPTPDMRRRIRGATIFNYTTGDARVLWAAGNTAPTVPDPAFAPTVMGFHIPAAGSLEIDGDDNAAGAVLVCKLAVATPGRIVIEGKV